MLERAFEFILQKLIFQLKVMSNAVFKIMYIHHAQSSWVIACYWSPK